MAKEVNKLTPQTIKKLSDPKYYLDGNGLYLQISIFGTKSWVFKYTLNGRTREMGLGPEHTITLAEAREAATAQRKLLLQGKDPIEERDAAKRALRLEAAKRISFAECAQQYINTHKKEWKNSKHHDQWKNTIATYVDPHIGALAVGDIDTPLVMKCLGSIWTEKPETANRLRGRIEKILDYAKAMQWRAGENPARWKGHLDHLLPAQSRNKRIKHFPALPYTELGEFMATLRQVEGSSAKALEFLILTTARSGEVRGAKWIEMDTVDEVWYVPGERMKGGIDHRVPLSEPALAILERMKKSHSTKGFVFPGSKEDSSLSDMSLTALIRRMDADRMEKEGKGWRDPKGDVITAHGFRSTFRDWAAERTNYAREVAEHALAHKLPDKVEAAYQRGDLLEKRRRMMEDWATFCSQEYKAGEVIPLRSNAA